MAKLQILRDKGLLNPMVINDKLMTQSNYVDRLEKLSKEQEITSGVKALPTRNVLYDALENQYFLEHEVKHLFVTKPKFSKYTKVDEIYRRMLKVKFPENEWWVTMTDLF